MNDAFKTLESPSQGLFRNKGSRFLSFAIPVDNETLIKDKLSEIKKEYFDARHHCYAYRIGYHGEYYRANDDGEPSGTAGRPILGQIDSFGLTNVLIVVVRYFGGILLGTGGLVEAYKSASHDALNNGTIITRYIYNSCTLSFSYEHMNDAMRLIKESGATIIDMKSESECQIDVSLRQQAREDFCDKLKLLQFIQCNWT